MNRLWIKLTLSFMVIALVTAGIMAFLTARSTGAGFRQYVVRAGMNVNAPAIGALEGYYQANGGWDGVDQLLSQLGHGAGSAGRGRGTGGQGASGWTLVDGSGRVIASPDSSLLGRQLQSSVLALGVPLTTDGRVVGTVLNLAAADVVLDAQGEAFLSGVRRSLLLAGLSAVGLSVLLGLLGSRLLTARLRRLSDATAAIASGNFSGRVAETEGDEVGDLGRAFNLMAESLERGELQRRNMTADIAHELRTPLAVIQGNLQAMLDGVYPLDAAQIAIIYDETRLLGRLVDDLRELALAEAGQLRLEDEPIDLRDLALKVVAGFQPAAELTGVTMAIEAPPGIPPLSGDADRLGQVMRNLLGNALRHTPSGGRVSVILTADGDQVRVSVSDTGTGIAPEDRPYVFDRFYRGDKSRSRLGGSTGLGLAIANQIVLAHGGTITVNSAPGEGATFTVNLPTQTA